MTTVIINDTFQSLAGGGYDVEFVTYTNQSGSVALSDTDDDWDTVQGGGGLIFMDHAQANIIGGGYTINPYNNPPAMDLMNTIELYGTDNSWDQVNVSDDTVVLNSAQANIIGGNNTIDLDYNGVEFFYRFFTSITYNIVELYGTWQGRDNVFGNLGHIALNAAQANVTGQDNTILFVGPVANFVQISGTDDLWDTVQGSNGAIALSGGQANVIGGGNTISMDSASEAWLISTQDNWDQVTSSGARVSLDDARANVIGGGNSIYEQESSIIEIYGTNGNPDNVYSDYNAALLVLNNSQARIYNYGFTVNILGTIGNSLDIFGANAFVSFQPGFGPATVSGFATDDGMAFSHVDFANWQALQAHMSQSGDDVLIARDPSDIVRLTNVQLTGLTASQFHFV